MSNEGISSVLVAAPDDIIASKDTDGNFRQISHRAIFVHLRKNWIELVIDDNLPILPIILRKKAFCP